MTIHEYLMKAVQDDARRAGERDRLLREARRARRARRQRLVPAAPARRRTEMGKIVVSENVTLDGVIQDPAGRGVRPRGLSANRATMAGRSPVGVGAVLGVRRVRRRECRRHGSGVRADGPAPGASPGAAVRRRHLRDCAQPPARRPAGSQRAGHQPGHLPRRSLARPHRQLDRRDHARLAAGPPLAPTRAETQKVTLYQRQKRMFLRSSDVSAMCGGPPQPTVTHIRGNPLKEARREVRSKLPFSLICSRTSSSSA